MEVTEIQLLVFVTTIIVLVLAIALIFFFAYFQEKKTHYLVKQRETELLFEEEITKSKLEIQEQALQNISWEIHDNVGQLLSTARMQLNMMQYALPKAQQIGIEETSEIIGKSLNELRGLAKSLNPETIKNKGLVASLKQEFERYNRLNFIQATLTVSDNYDNLTNDKEIILFRILQEFCNNSLKYSKAAELTIDLMFENNCLNITAKDNGIGFDIDDSSMQTGIGLLNIKSRGALIGAKIELKSTANVGTKLYISCPI